MSPRVSRWSNVVLALASGLGFAISVYGGRWWSFADSAVSVGPLGSQRCFSGSCSKIGFAWVGGSARFERFANATWAAGLFAMLLLLFLAGATAAGRRPKLVAKSTLVGMVCAVASGIGFIALWPGMQGAALDRGAVFYFVAAALGAIAAIRTLRSN